MTVVALVVSIIAVLLSAGAFAVSLATYLRADKWRSQERVEAEPNFIVYANPVNLWARNVRPGEEDRGTERVRVAVQNLATESATIATALIRKAEDSSSFTVLNLDSLPSRLEPRGGQLTFDVSGVEFERYLADTEGLPEQFVVSVSMETPTQVPFSEQVWSSGSFTVRPLRADRTD